MAWHAVFKEFLTNILKKQNIYVKVEQEVGKLPLKIDMIIKKEEGKETNSKYLKSFITHLEPWNIIELKTAGETVTFSKILKVVGYFGFFCSQETFYPKDVKATMSWILTSQKPVKLFNQLKQYGWSIKNCGFPGCYETFFYVPMRFIVFSELPLEEEYYPFLLFSRGKKLEKFISHVLSQNNKVFINWSYLLYKEKLTQMAKAQNKTLDNITKSMMEVILEIGLDNVIETFGIEKVIESVGIEKVIESVGIEKVLSQIPLEDIEKFIKNRKTK